MVSSLSAAVKPRRIAIAIAGLLLLSRLRAATPPQGGPIIGSTTAVQLLEDRWEALSPMPWPRYQETARRLSSVERFVSLRGPLREEGSTVSYGLNVVVPVNHTADIRNLSWALIEGGGKPPTLIVDANANGVLSDDPRIEFERAGPSEFAARREWKVRDAQSPNEEVALPVRWRAVRMPDGFALSVSTWRERRGSVTVGGGTYTFVLRAWAPTFDAPGSLVGIDLDGDGAVQEDAETFFVEEGSVSIAGAEHKMIVDRHGRSLELVPTGRRGEERPSLAVGTRAPALPDSVRAPGRVLLLNFWSPKCGFSRRMAPALRAVRVELREVQFVSITDAAEEDALGFARAAGHDWLQVAGEAGRELFRTFRVRDIPTYYVIGADGVIRARGHTNEWSQIRAELIRLSPAHPAESPLELPATENEKKEEGER